MSYYQLNRDRLLEKSKDRYHNDGGKEKAAEYYEDNRDVVLWENPRNTYRNLSEEEKEVKRAYGRDRYRNMTEGENSKLKKYQRNYQAAKY